MGFEGQRILITGSTRGIGRTVAECFVQAGARVAVNGRSAERVREVVGALGEERAVEAPGDLSAASGCEAVVARSIEALGGLDVLINNAGIYPIGAIEQTDEAAWDAAMDANVKSMFFCTRAALPALRASRGAIVNHASNAGLQGFAGVVLYCASKGAVVSMTRAMALELAPEIRVNCVCPATIDSEMGWTEFNSSADPQAAFAAFEAATPMQRIGKKEDVAEAMLFLASQRASYLTGVALPVDGGKSAGPAKKT